MGGCKSKTSAARSTRGEKYRKPTMEKRASVSAMGANPLAASSIVTSPREKVNPPMVPSNIVKKAQASNPHIAVEMYEGQEQAIQAIYDSCTSKNAPNVTSSPVVRGWKTIRIFVSSTFADMHYEREVLVKTVFPQIRVFCEKYKLRVVECDLRWGVPRDTTGDETLRICLSEVDRCREENGFPFFINMLSDRYGWVPMQEHVPQDVQNNYDWIMGLSVTHMEIMHAAFRDANPNALFLLRAPGYLSKACEVSGVEYNGAPPPAGDADQEGVVAMNPGILREFLPQFLDQPPFAAKLATLKELIKLRFPQQYHTYNVRCSGECDPTGKLMLTGYDEFIACTKTFLERAIEKAYPLDPTPPDVIALERGSHDVFVESRGEVVLGRDEVLKTITDFAFQQPTSSRVPMLVLGHAGAGKSAVMAKVARDAISWGDQWLVFYHFVGATPGSTDLVRLLHRIWRELSFGQDTPTDTDELVKSTPNFIKMAAKNLKKKIVILIDAINQLDTDDESQLLRWLPSIFPGNVSVVLSMIVDTPVHKKLYNRENIPTTVEVGPLDQDSKMQIVSGFMKVFNKKLDDRQLQTLTSKEGSGNPLWLLTACEELRLFGIFELIDEKIAGLAEGLLDLLQQVLTRLGEELDREHLVATVCLLETSRHGLLEGEILQLLYDKTTLVYTPEEEVDVDNIGKDSGESSRDNHDVPAINATSSVVDHVHSQKQEAYRKDGATSLEEKKEQKRVEQEKQRLPYSQWVPLYNSLRRFLRPCGESGEGRLDFYHRTVSKAVRLKYFDGEEGTKYKLWWHGKLASFFEDHGDNLRRSEELPFHLEKVLDNSKLAKVLVEWEMFEFLLNSPEKKLDLLRWWRSIGGYGVAEASYRAALEVLRKDPTAQPEEITKRSIQVGRFLGHVGQFSGSVDILEQVLESMGKEDTLDKADVLTFIGEVLEMKRGSSSQTSMEEVGRTVEYCEKSAEIRRKLKSTDQAGLANTLFCLMMNLVHQSKFDRKVDRNAVLDRASRAAEECFEIRQRIHDPQLGEAMMGLAMPLWQNNNAKVEKLKEAYEFWKKTEGVHHLGTARVASNIGLCYRGNAETAAQYHCHSYVVRADLYGKEHPKTERSKDELSQAGYDPEACLQEYQKTGVVTLMTE